MDEDTPNTETDETLRYVFSNAFVSSYCNSLRNTLKKWLEGSMGHAGYWRYFMEPKLWRVQYDDKFWSGNTVKGIQAQQGWNCCIETVLELLLTNCFLKCYAFSCLVWIGRKQTCLPSKLGLRSPPVPFIPWTCCLRRTMNVRSVNNVLLPLALGRIASHDLEGSKWRLCYEWLLVDIVLYLCVRWASPRVFCP